MAHTSRAVVFSFLGVTVPLLTGGCAREASRPSERVVAFRYTASLTGLPAQASPVRLWIPLAKTRENQRVLSRRIEVARPYEIHEEPVFGNDILYLALTPPLPRPFSVVIDYEVALRRGRRLAPRPLVHVFGGVASADDVATALRNEPLMVVDETVTRLARGVTESRTTNLQKARAIYDYVIAHMRYDKTTPGWGRGDTLRACALGKGNCTDFHSLFISMGRAVGLPARFVIGVSLPREPAGEIPGYHCWAEFYSPRQGWVPVDASEAWKHPDLRDYYFGTRDENRVSISVGRNIRLVPAQAGAPVNIFVYPYAEVDGLPGGVIETRFQFRDRNTREART